MNRKIVAYISSHEIHFFELYLKQISLLPLNIVPSRPSFLDHCFGTFWEGAYSTIVLNWAPKKREAILLLWNPCVASVYCKLLILIEVHKNRLIEKNERSYISLSKILDLDSVKNLFFYFGNQGALTSPNNS